MGTFDFIMSKFEKSDKSDNPLDAAKLLDLVGHSIYHPDIDKALREFNVKVTDKSKLSRYDSLKSKTYGVTFTFWYKEFYEQQIRKPQSIFKPKDVDEVLLYELTFSQAKNINFILPYGLNFNDTSEVVSNKLGQKPFSKSKNYVGQFIWTFYNDLFEIMSAFDDDKQLCWLRIIGLNNYDKKKIEFKNNLKAQNRNINQNKIENLKLLKKEKPTKNWTKRMIEGDSMFNKNCINESEELLDSFIDDLIEATKSKNASKVFSKVKKVIVSFNKLNKKYNSFIETMEREELAEFIEQATQLTGFVIYEGVDITEDIREW